MPEQVSATAPSTTPPARSAGQLAAHLGRRCEVGRVGRRNDLQVSRWTG